MLAIDMDGTCLNTKNRISPQTLDAMQLAAEAGIEIVPATGRALTCLPHQLKDLPYIRYVISSNGAVVTDLKTNRSIFDAMIPAREACGILDQCHRFDLGITAHANNKSLVEGKTLAAFGRLSYGRDVANAVCVKSVSEYLKANAADVEELQFFPFSTASRQKVLSVLDAYPQLVTVSTSKYMEIFSSGATKGNAVAALARHLAFRQEHIACIGDGSNDLTMFAASGLTFAVGNAVQPLKNAADHIVPSNNDGGVATAILRYLL